jgi:guanylate kinase
MKKHNLLCVVGRTGSGKDTLVNKLCDKLSLRKVLSYTTRKQRDNNDNTHLFVNEDLYQAHKCLGVISAETVINGNRYWTVNDQLLYNDVYIIDPDGLETLKNNEIYKQLNIITVYIRVPESTRKSRVLVSRGDDEEVFKNREQSESEQFDRMLRNESFDYCITNENLDKAYTILKRVCELEKIGGGIND